MTTKAGDQVDNVLWIITSSSICSGKRTVVTARANWVHVRCADWSQDSRQHARKKRSSRPHWRQQAAATASQLSDTRPVMETLQVEVGTHEILISWIVCICIEYWVHLLGLFWPQLAIRLSYLRFGEERKREYLLKISLWKQHHQRFVSLPSLI